jgi:type VI secretion system protein ImpF
VTTRVARTELERTVLPSLWDRLTDEAPGVPGDPSISRAESVARYRAAVRRDVELLLNSRRTIVDVPEALAPLIRSVFTYGLPDVTGMAPQSKEGRERLQRWVRDAVERHEPRLADVRVAITEAEPGRIPQVRFTLSAMLFDTVLDLGTGAYALRDETDGGAA